MKNIQVIHDQCDSIIFLETFSLGYSKQLLYLPLADKKILLTGSGIYLQILELYALLFLFAKCPNNNQVLLEVISLL